MDANSGTRGLLGIHLLGMLVPGGALEASPRHDTSASRAARSPAPGAKHVLPYEESVRLTLLGNGRTHEVRAHLQRMRALAMAAAGPEVSVRRASLDTEFRALVGEIERIARATEFHGIRLLDGTNTFVSIQLKPAGGVVASLRLQNLTTSNLGLQGLDVSSFTTAALALRALDQAADTARLYGRYLDGALSRLLRHCEPD